MADTDTRRDYRGGPGRGFKRKRFGEDDDLVQGHRQQRQRQDVPPGTRLRRGLLEIAEDPLRLAKDVAVNLAKLAVEHWDDEYVRDTLANTVLKLVVEQPFKIPFVAGVVLYANDERPEVVRELLGRLGVQLQEALDAGNWRDCKLLLRFTACLSPLYQEDGIYAILDELFNRAVDLQTASSEDVAGIELVKIILLTIPYWIASGDPSLQQKAAEILEKTDIVASAPHPFEPSIDPYPTSSQEEKPMACPSVIAMLQKQLQEEMSNGWSLALIPRVYEATAANDTHNDVANGDSEMKTSERHPFPSVSIPSPVQPGSKTLFPERYFSLFADQEVESVPSTSNIASTLLRDAIADTINILDFNRNVVAKLLNDIDCFWTPGTFIKRATQFDKLRDVPEGKAKWKPEDVSIDAIFSQIFQLPAPEHRLVYYHSLITESCKISPQAVAPSLGRAIRFLYRHVDSMDMELYYRYMDWFSHHLSNFEFRWKWTEWTAEVDLPDIDPRKAFINGILDKEIRLSFAKRIRETLPEPFRPLIPSSKEKDIPDFKYADDQTPYASEGREVLALLKRKAPEEEIDRVLEPVHEQAINLGATEPLVPSTDIYMTAICSIGSKSLSHVLSTIDRCKQRLLTIGSKSEDARRQIITSVVDFWAEHPGTAVNIVDKLLNYSIVTPMSVIHWALTDHLNRGRILASAQAYELVSTTMFKVVNRIRGVVRERNNPNLLFAQRQQLDQLLPGERQNMRDMFAAITDAVSSVANGTQDSMIERFDDDEGTGERELIMFWGQRWEQVWKRKAAVEEAIVGESVIGPLGEDSAPAAAAAAAEEPDMDVVE
ncbi:hypothetical protein K431DRAFT_308173 [Polychaeton citri CBS 116435]|uniref:Cap binding protein n=1 Tax=Polychaeton citri CBS 116435 TaxID=1314669 RepID=A0A9P4UHP1_9PEZI|nr:hypothetical protein K431DRAFT_308173 [Polychaeton citri CBS 116435]